MAHMGIFGFRVEGRKDYVSMLLSQNYGTFSGVPILRTISCFGSFMETIM